MKKAVALVGAPALAAISFWGGTFYQSRRFAARRDFGMPQGVRTQGRQGGPGAFRGGPRERLISGRLDKVSKQIIVKTEIDEERNSNAKSIVVQ